MIYSRLSQRPARILAGTLIIVASACSKRADQQPAVDSGTSSAAVSPAADSTGTRDSTARDTMTTPPRDTSTARGNHTDSVHGTQENAAKSTPVKPKVRPNIDPGRIGTKPRAVPTTTSTESTATSSAPPSEAATSGQQDQQLTYDAKSNTVTFQLIGGPNGFQFNGFSNGGATLTLPGNANVLIHFVNKDGTPHSAEVISGEGPIPNAGGDAAIPRAYTNKLLEGLPQEASDDMRFTVPASGKYRIFCGVPGHGLSGMWIWVVVDPAAKTPSFGPTKS
jgi:sulfocyanin